MHLQILKVKDLPVAIIDNFFNDKEISAIWKELSFLSSKLLDPNDTGSAIDATGQDLKKNKGIWIHQVLNPEYSDIINVHKKLYDLQIKQSLASKSNFFEFLFCEFEYDVLLSRYNEGDYYKPHADTALMSCITWLYSEPKKFTGGDFNIAGNHIQLKNARTVIFPSCLIHNVEPVKMESDAALDGRFSVSSFIHPVRY